MPFDFPLPASLAKAGWRVKIREKETCEPPHVTILRGTQAWRINLRTGKFMDPQPNPKEVPASVLDQVLAVNNWQWLRDEWDRKYPKNRVAVPQDEE